MTTKIRSETIAASKLSDAVNRAAKIVSDRHLFSVSDANLVTNWKLIGRIARDANLAHQFSGDVTAVLGKSLGISVEPATFQIGKQILVGFVQSERLPISRKLILRGRHPVASKMSSRLSCPSAQPDRAQARVIGVVSGTPEMPRIAYLKDEAVISASELPDVGALAVTEVFRIAAQCEEHRCSQFSGGRCSLGQRLVDGVILSSTRCRHAPFTIPAVGSTNRAERPACAALR